MERRKEKGKEGRRGRGRDGGRDRGRDEETKGGMERRKEGGKEGQRERRRERGRQRGRDGGSEGGRDRDRGTEAREREEGREVTEYLVQTLSDTHTPLQTCCIWNANVHLAIKPSKPPEGRVHTVGSVGGSHDNHMRSLLEPIHECQQLGDNTSLHLTMSLLRESEGGGREMVHRFEVNHIPHIPYLSWEQWHPAHQ